MKKLSIIKVKMFEFDGTHNFSGIKPAVSFSNCRKYIKFCLEVSSDMMEGISEYSHFRPAFVYF